MADNLNLITTAYANIALIKYWGKRDEILMLPTKSSLSVTLEALKTETHISLSNVDYISINGENASSETFNKFQTFLDKFRKKFKTDKKFSIKTINHFPTSAGLASSASGFAALTIALNRICSLNLDKKNISIMARQGSGSACRSIYDGFVFWNKGVEKDGSDSFASQLFTSNHWPELRIMVVILQSNTKKISSSRAMKISVETSKSYNNWIKKSESRIYPMIDAIKHKNLDKLGKLAELDCMEMHETMNDSTPSINYLNEKTFAVIELVKTLRKNSVQCYFTIDAGPNVKIITTTLYQDAILQKLESFKDVIQHVIVSKIA